MALKSRLPEIAAELPTAIAAAERAAAETVVNAAKARVPVKTGRLRNAIHAEMEVEATRGRVVTWVYGGDSQAWYGHIVEHGSRKSPAHPFLAPALEASRGKIIGATVSAIRKAT